MLRILHVIGGAETGGSRKQIISLIERFAEETDYTADIICLLEGPVLEDARAAGLNVTVLPMKWTYDLRVLFPLMKRMRSYDIVHTHGVRAGFVGRIAAKLSRIPVIVTTVHSSTDHDYQSFFKRTFYGFVDKLTMGFADRIIVVSETLRQELKQRGIPEDKLVTIYNSIALEELRTARGRDSVRAELGVSPAAKLITAVGRMVPVKGHRYLLSAFREVAKRFPEARLMVVGNGPLYDVTVELAHELELDKRVIFTGFRNDVPDLLVASDVFVLPSLMEGLPSALLEAMALGIPIVASEVGGIPEVVEDEVTGLLVEAKDSGGLALAISRLLSDPALRDVLGRTGREVVENRFSITTMFRGISELYQELLQDRVKQTQGVE